MRKKYIEKHVQHCFHEARASVLTCFFSTYLQMMKLTHHEAHFWTCLEFEEVNCREDFSKNVSRQNIVSSQGSVLRTLPVSHTIHPSFDIWSLSKCILFLKQFSSLDSLFGFFLLALHLFFFCFSILSSSAASSSSYSLSNSLCKVVLIVLPKPRRFLISLYQCKPPVLSAEEADVSLH